MRESPITLHNLDVAGLLPLVMGDSSGMFVIVLVGLAYSPVSCSVVSPFGPVPQVLQFKACLHKYFFKIVDELSSSVIAVALKRL